MNEEENNENNLPQDLREFEELKDKLLDIALKTDDLTKQYILGSLEALVQYLKS